MELAERAKRWLEVESGPAPIDPLHSMHLDGELIDHAREIITGLLEEFEKK